MNKKLSISLKLTSFLIIFFMLSNNFIFASSEIESGTDFTDFSNAVFKIENDTSTDVKFSSRQKLSISNVTKKDNHSYAW